MSDISLNLSIENQSKIEVSFKKISSIKITNVVRYEMCLHEKISKRVLDKNNRCKDYLKNVPHLHKVLEFSFVNFAQNINKV